MTDCISVVQARRTNHSLIFLAALAFNSCKEWHIDMEDVHPTARRPKLAFQEFRYLASLI